MTDLVKLYNHPLLDPDAGPQQLQNKVQLDIRYYFCRRGGENVHAFKKDTFELVFDTDTRITYVKKAVDELTKNHRENDNNKITGFMPQLLDTDGRPHRLCPVRCFENYIFHLNPKIDNLWQQPGKGYPNAETWFRAIPLGHNPLDTFMGKLSDRCELSDHYNNHCIRVTGVSNLMRSGRYTPKQVMAVSGHKSIHSLAIYQRVRDDEKMMMGMSLTYSLLNADEVYKFKLAQQMKENEVAVQEDAHAPLPAPPVPQLIAPPVMPLQPLQQVPQQLPQLPQPSTSKQDQILPPSIPTSAENSVIPYNPPNNNQDVPGEIPQDIDFLEMLCDDMNNEDENHALVLAAQQIEAQLAQSTTTTTTSKTALMTKKNVSTAPTFLGCKFGNIGTLNIHIHKH